MTYADGSSDEVEVTVRVKPLKEKYSPEGKKVITHIDELPDARNSISNVDNLPPDAKYSWHVAPDVATDGEKNATVKVTYADGSEDTIDVVVKVLPNIIP